MRNHRFLSILLVVSALLLIPFIAMKFTDEVHWTLFDFVVAALLLSSTGLGIELIIRKTKSTPYRIALSLAVFMILCLTWVELAVGIFGSPLAGN